MSSADLQRGWDPLRELEGAIEVLCFEEVKASDIRAPVSRVENEPASAFEANGGRSLGRMELHAPLDAELFGEPGGTR